MPSYDTRLTESFNVDVKHKERREPIPGESKGVLGSFGINVGGGSKFVEQDDVSFLIPLKGSTSNNFSGSMTDASILML